MTKQNIIQCGKSYHIKVGHGILEGGEKCQDQAQESEHPLVLTLRSSIKLLTYILRDREKEKDTDRDTDKDADSYAEGLV